VSETPERDALRAKCEAENLRCPSCHVLWADLPADHNLAMLGPLKCQDGQAITEPSDFTTFRLAVNTQAFDEYSRSVDAGLAQIFGDLTGEPRFTGLGPMPA
jgi:hypothetical protein